MAFLPFGLPTFFSCIAHCSTRHTVVNRPVNPAALGPQGAYRSLSRRSRRHRMASQTDLAYGTWTSCRFARWGAGHRTGRMCGSLVVIFDQARDVPDASKGRAQDPFAYNWTIRYIVRSRIALWQLVATGVATPKSTSRPHLYR